MNNRFLIPVWTLVLFVVVMNTTMFNVSVPGIIRDLGVTADQGSWIVSSYSIGYALSTIVYSRLSDVYPIRRLVAIGLLVLGLSSVYGLFAHTFYSLLLARILQSAGSGAMSGIGLVLTSRYIPFERRGRAIAMISAGSAMAFGLGPIVGGTISDYFGWNGLFGVTCLVLIILPLLLRLLPKEEQRYARFDVLGAALTIVNAASLLVAVAQRSVFWLAVCAVSLRLQMLHLYRAGSSKGTFINVELLRKPAYRKLLAVGFSILVLNMSNLFLMPLVLADIGGLSELQIGLTIAPGAIFSALMTRYVGRWIDQYGNLRFLLAGHVLLAAVLACFAWSPGLPTLVILLGYFVFSPAFTTTIASLNNETSSILEKPQISAGMGFLQLLQFFGGSISVAVAGHVIELNRGAVPLHPYQTAYRLLFAVSLISLGLLWWYKRRKLNPLVVQETG